MKFSAIIALAVSALMVQASPIDLNAEPKQLEKRGTYHGKATWYTQDGTIGSCGKKHGDYDMIVAVNEHQKTSNKKYCGKTVTITHKKTGKKIKAKVADTCPGCSYGSLDLSLGAFKKLGSLDDGVLPITWKFNN